MINIDLFRRKSFGCLTRVVHKSSWAKLKPRHATPQKEINIGKLKHNQLEWNEIYIFYSPNTWMVSFQKVFWSKIAVAGHETRYLFRLTFSGIMSIFAILLSQCLFAKRIEKKTNITQTIVCRLIVSVLQTNSAFSRFLLLSSSFNSKLSANPSWVKCCIFKTSQRGHSLERAQEVKFFPQWSGEGQKSVLSMSSDIFNFCTCATGCQKFSDIR